MYENERKGGHIIDRLYPHQIKAINMMEKLEREKEIITTTYKIETEIGIYADMIGYGKTSSIIGLIYRDKCKWDEDIYKKELISTVLGNGSIVEKTMMEYKKINGTLIICNSSIMKQWKDEIELYTLEYRIIKKKKDIYNLIKTSIEEDIILCLPGLYNTLMDNLKLYAWKRFIYDEPIYTKIQCMKKITSRFNWFITSTPYDLINKYTSGNHYLSSIFSNNMDIKLMNNIIIKNSEEDIKKNHIMPAINHLYYECYLPSLYIIKNLMTEEILKMISENDIEQAIKALGGNIISDVYKFIYDLKKLELKNISLKIDLFDNNNILDRKELSLSKKQFILNHIDGLKNRYHDILQNTCHICLSLLTKPIFVFCCHNVFCAVCLFEWIKTKISCPICRNEIYSPMIYYIDSKAKMGYFSTIKTKTKMETLLNILDSNITGKFIVFSNDYDSILNIQKFLIQEKIPCIQIKGNMKLREKQLKDFYDSSYHIVLLIKSFVNYAGINLQHVSDIIFYNKLHQQLQIQIIGMAYRLGRILPINIHHLYS